ncbi:alanine--tRNA ligase [Parasutterella muris]|uniref:alanine--tRNA ligase n=1 Tax=Parasutterella muris TaxID=2565572 RepID=UPI00203D5BCE|nr:alanine--tRNA ligase [Parasutterella muris]
MFTASEIRSTFLKFMESKGHTIVASSPVVPGDDPTLLFTNAGMNQFKDVFLGFDKRPYKRATTSQKCVRAGGKHNDLENVGYTARHHTFFEMLGNFSFGDYFKRDAIKNAWELLTQHFMLPPEKLWVTVYAEDDEAYDIWNKEVGVPAERIVRIGDNKGARYASDNFWMMGDTGPCGPCSEIFYDHGEDVAGGPPGSPDEDGDRYIEIWNLVFMQFNRDEKGEMHPLPRPSVDTGMGLERISAVLQHVHSNYDIDLFQNLMRAVVKAVEEAGGENVDPNSPSVKVIADHIRACTFIIADGILPGNEGRSYVLRRIARRGMRHGFKLGARDLFFSKLVKAVAKEMGDQYPETRNPHIEEVLRQEEVRFSQTLAKGLDILNEALVDGTKVLGGDVAFKLHDTYGFPVDLTADVCRERGVTVDFEGFDAAMEKQREKARATGKFKMAQGLEYEGSPTEFLGYKTLAVHACRVEAIYKDGEPVKDADAGDEVVVVFDKTPFYAESGGQMGDKGVFKNNTTILKVDDTFKIKADVFGHMSYVAEGSVKVGDLFSAKVDEENREATARNHSVTHLMHKALREVLGQHVQQRGSMVNGDRTRFDFVHTSPMTAEQIREVEDIVNKEILRNTATHVRVMPLDEAKKTEAVMLFGEKYGENVRVLNIGSSCELCGGTHVQRTGDIGMFKIVSESGISAGVRRVEAVTGMSALRYTQKQEAIIHEVAEEFKAPTDEVVSKVVETVDHLKRAEKELDTIKVQLAQAGASSVAAKAEDIGGAKLLVTEMKGVETKALRDSVDSLKDQLKSAAVVLVKVEGGKASIAVGVTKDLVSKVKAGDVVKFIAEKLGGKGGGRPDFAQGGGNAPADLSALLAQTKTFVAEKLQ